MQLSNNTLEYRKKYYSENREKYTKWRFEWRKNNPQKYREAVKRQLVANDKRRLDSEKYAEWKKAAYLGNIRRKKERYILLRKLKDSPCTDCNVKYPYYVMQFDHVRGIKRNTISRMLSNSLTVFMREVEKCEVVCANCHFERTFSRKIRAVH